MGLPIGLLILILTKLYLFTFLAYVINQVILEDPNSSLKIILPPVSNLVFVEFRAFVLF
jgi:hypothetical protein